MYDRFSFSSKYIPLLILYPSVLKGCFYPIVGIMIDIDIYPIKINSVFCGLDIILILQWFGGPLFPYPPTTGNLHTLFVKYFFVFLIFCKMFLFIPVNTVFVTVKKFNWLFHWEMKLAELLLTILFVRPKQLM